MPEALYVGDEAVLSAVKRRRKCGETVKPRVFRKPERDGRGKAVKARGLGTELAIGRAEDPTRRTVTGIFFWFPIFIFAKTFTARRNAI